MSELLISFFRKRISKEISSDPISALYMAAESCVCINVGYIQNKFLLWVTLCTVQSAIFGGSSLFGFRFYGSPNSVHKNCCCDQIPGWKSKFRFPVLSKLVPYCCRLAFSSLPWIRQLSRDVPAGAGILSGKVSVLWKRMTAKPCASRPNLGFIYLFIQWIPKC